ncbi:prolyl oligopeptidase family serine peptidase [Undibacterium sp. Jales W-56]|uniref:prolyl oligopeptidase family serine peptidase n=1 Tax=Undibacterium sp. Jales W-56 TaxID=2897325 RepID=UPI0021D01254|nr:prolyl oligopeptidase family serine peptidase [Undibacterium sp. Jales W-56]MCU6435125.1 prolyl oligopeptidase family serine peptidase [Undibacterium sp. Jales W-56]
MDKKNRFLRLIALLALLVSMALLAACSSTPPSSVGIAGITSQRFDFADGGQAIFFSIDKNLSANDGLTMAGASAATSVLPQTLVFVVPGSGCISMGKYLPDYFRGLEGESGALRIMILQKRHSQQNDIPCSAAFIRDDHLSRWQADQGEFIESQLRLLQSQGQRPKRVLIMGISEGAELAALLAARMPVFTHLALISNGGMQPLDAFRLLANKRNDAGLRIELQRIDEALDNASESASVADNQILVNGRSRQYWQELNQLRHSEHLFSWNKPVLICMGEADQALPVESVYWLEREFSRAKKTNLQLHVYPAADHGLRSSNQQHLPDCLHQIDLWLEKF